VRDRLHGDLEAGTVRPGWCWSAYDDGDVLARHHWWGPVGAEAPIVLVPLDAPTDDLEAAVELVTHARTAVGAREAWSEVTIAADEPGDPWSARPARVALLERTDFRFEVDRVRVEWRGTVATPGTDRLTFRPATEMPDDDLVALFAAVADDSLDHGMSGDRVRLGRDGEARKRLGFNLAYPGVDGRFAVGVDGAGETVGYVVPALHGDLGVIAEIGVAGPYRGRGYVHDLLAYGTATVAVSGARRVVADTDCGNAPMRAAFTRAGYREFARRWDWGWRHDA
jgi:RimJ/RimL family protein N-acetyltransferase